jgi:hypothetical protein
MQCQNNQQIQQYERLLGGFPWAVAAFQPDALAGLQQLDAPAAA